MATTPTTAALHHSCCPLHRSALPILGSSVDRLQVRRTAIVPERTGVAPRRTNTRGPPGRGARSAAERGWEVAHHAVGGFAKEQRRLPKRANQPTTVAKKHLQIVRPW